MPIPLQSQCWTGSYQGMPICSALFVLHSRRGQMRASRFTDEQIIAIVREYEAGAKLTELCRRHGISSATFYKWRGKNGGMGGFEGNRGRGAAEGEQKLRSAWWGERQNIWGARRLKKKIEV